MQSINFLPALIENVSLFSLIVVAYTLIRQRMSATRVQGFALGIAFGFGGILVMSFGVHLPGGGVVDTRAVIIALAAEFAGPVGALIATSIAILYRLSLGGESAYVAAINLVATCLIGLAFAVARRRGVMKGSFSSYAGLGVAVVASVWSIGAVLNPQQTLAALPTVLLPLLIVVPGGTALLAAALNHEAGRITMQAQLHRQTQLFQAIFDSIPAGIVVADRAGRMSSSNQRALSMGLGPTTGRVDSRDVGKFGTFEPDGVTPFDVRNSPLLAAVSGKVSDDVEMVLHNEQTNGPIRIVASARPLFDVDGHPAGAVSILRDITHERIAAEALRRSEERFSLAIAGSRDGIFDYNPITRSVWFSTRYKEILGYSDEDFPNDIKFWKELMLPEDHAATTAQFHDYEAGLCQDLHIMQRFRHKAGHLVHLSSRAQGSRGVDGKVVRLIGVVTDMTPVMERETELRRANERLEAQADELATLAHSLEKAREDAVKSSESKSSFLAGMSHEIRTPLNAVIGFADLMHRGVYGPVEPPRYREYLTYVHQAGMHLLSLINDLLDLSKIEAGKLEIEIRPLRSAGVLEEIRSVLGPAAEAGRIEIELPAEDVLLHADERALKQILLNLVSNAIKFTPPLGRIVLTVISEPEMARIQISDNGAGMTTEELAAALRPYEQATADSRLRRAGTGLGLPLAKALAELQGGTLELVSRKDEGTIATVALPNRGELRSGAGPSTDRA
jgi:PAS domain S-box-containing protein